VIRLELRCLGGTQLSELELDRLRFFLHGESSLVYALYELLCNDTCLVQLRPIEKQGDVKPIVLSPSSLRAVGFGPDEGMLPYTPRSFLGYRLLQEYFAFPEKFLFLDVCELERAVGAGFKEGVEILFFLDRVPRLEQPVNAGTFRLGCTPIINLFEQIAEPIRLNHAQSEYRVIPDVRRQNVTEVYAVNEVISTSPHLEEPLHFQPFYSVKHATDRERQRAFWHTSRRPSMVENDRGTEVYLSLVDLDFNPRLPAESVLVVRTTCTNRDLPNQLQHFGEELGFELEEVDITGDPALEAAYREWLPVVEIDGERAFVYFMDDAAFRRRLSAG
jgi:type VI secretion system protein ImpG